MPVIALGGIKHTGKSTVGRIISESESIEFTDLDDLIIRLLPSRWSIRKWYKEKGAEAFQKKESTALSLYLTEKDPSLIRILALGGGTLENTEAVRLLKESDSKIIVLNEEPGVLYDRIMAKGLPPFLDPDNPEESFRELYRKRTQTLLAKGDFVININGLDQYQAAELVIRQIREIAKMG